MNLVILVYTNQKTDVMINSILNIKGLKIKHLVRSQRPLILKVKELVL